MFPSKRTDKPKKNKAVLEPQKKVQYCLCCGYGTLPYISSYNYCPICLWRDDPASEFDPYIFNEENRFPLLIAKYNYERFGYSNERYKDEVKKPNGYEREEFFYTSKELAKKEWWYFLGSIFGEASMEHHELLDFYIDVFFYADKERSKEISEKILISEKYSYLWERVSVLYFDLLRNEADPILRDKFSSLIKKNMLWGK